MHWKCVVSDSRTKKNCKVSEIFVITIVEKCEKWIWIFFSKRKKVYERKIEFLAGSAQPHNFFILVRVQLTFVCYWNFQQCWISAVNLSQQRKEFKEEKENSMERRKSVRKFRVISYQIFDIVIRNESSCWWKIIILLLHCFYSLKTLHFDSVKNLDKKKQFYRFFMFYFHCGTRRCRENIFVSNMSIVNQKIDTQMIFFRRFLTIVHEWQKKGDQQISRTINVKKTEERTKNTLRRLKTPKTVSLSSPHIFTKC